MVAVSGGVPAGRTAGLGPTGISSGTRQWDDVHLCACCPLDFRIVSRAGWDFAGRSQLSSATVRSSHLFFPKDTAASPGRRASPALAAATRGRAPESHHLAGEPAAACVRVHVSDFCLCSHPHPLCKGFAGAILSLRGLHPTAPPSRPQECERALWAPLLVLSIGDSFPACVLSWGRLFPFLGKDTGSPVGQSARSLIAGRIRQKC